MEIVAVESVTLDGVMQAPGRPDEDDARRVRARRMGGALQRRRDGTAMGERMARGGALLLGRRTYEDFYGYWPKQTAQPVHRGADRTTKYVASTTLREPLPWDNSVLLEGEAVDAVRRMKGGDRTS